MVFCSDVEIIPFMSQVVSKNQLFTICTHLFLICCTLITCSFVRVVSVLASLAVCTKNMQSNLLPPKYIWRATPISECAKKSCPTNFVIYQMRGLNKSKVNGILLLSAIRSRLTHRFLSPMRKERELHGDPRARESGDIMTRKTKIIGSPVVRLTRNNRCSGAAADMKGRTKSRAAHYH